MINLLADSRKDDIRAGRVNVILSRYIGIILMALVFMMAVLGVSYTVLQNTLSTAETQIESNDVKADVYSGTKSQVDTLSAKLTDTKATLEQEISYAKVITTLGQLMPEGAIIGSLELNEASFSGAPMELKTYAKTNEGAVVIAEKLRGSPLITQVNLQSTDTAQGIEGYPIGVNLTITLNRAWAK